MPYKDTVKRRESLRRSSQRWRDAHRPLSTAEIEDRLFALGLAPDDSRPQIISLDDAPGAAAADRLAYRQWAAGIPFDGDEAGLEDPVEFWREQE